MNPISPMPSQTSATLTLSRSPSLRVLLFHGRGLISTLIRWQTRSQYSHAAIQLNDGSIIEAWQGAGVRKLPGFTRGTEGIDAFEITAPYNHLAVLEFLDSVLVDNDGYDYFGVLRFVSRRRARDNKKWFCSELVFAAIQAGGLNLFERTQPWEVSPGLLARSPYLRPVPLLPIPALAGAFSTSPLPQLPPVRHFQQVVRASPGAPSVSSVLKTLSPPIPA